MNLNERFDVQEAKILALKERIARLGVDVAGIEESFTRGGGKGGQKVDKTSNCVLLRYPPMQIVVRCARERRRTVNRFLALRELVDRIEERVSPETSPRLREREKARKRKSRRKTRALQKCGMGRDNAR